MKKFLSYLIVFLLAFTVLVNVKADEADDADHYRIVWSDFLNRLDRLTFRDDAEIEWSSTASSITFSNGNGISTQFNYADGILEIEPHASGFDERMFDNTAASIVFAVFYEGDNIDDFYTALQAKFVTSNQTVYTLANNGFEYTFLTAQETVEEDGEPVTKELESFSTLKVNLTKKSEISTTLFGSTPSIQGAPADSGDDTNPDTGISYRYGLILIIAILSLLSFISIRKRSKFLKHN